MNRQIEVPDEGVSIHAADAAVPLHICMDVANHKVNPEHYAANVSLRLGSVVLVKDAP